MFVFEFKHSNFIQSINNFCCLPGFGARNDPHAQESSSRSARDADPAVLATDTGGAAPNLGTANVSKADSFKGNLEGHKLSHSDSRTSDSSTVTDAHGTDIPFADLTENFDSEEESTLHMWLPTQSEHSTLQCVEATAAHNPRNSREDNFKSPNSLAANVLSSSLPRVHLPALPQSSSRFSTTGSMGINSQLTRFVQAPVSHLQSHGHNSVMASATGQEMMNPSSFYPDDRVIGHLWLPPGIGSNAVDIAQDPSTLSIGATVSFGQVIRSYLLFIGKYLKMLFLSMMKVS